MEALYFSKNKEKINCLLCPNYCTLAPGESGSCRVRHNADGELRLPHYGFITAFGIDPIEKKPLYHFHPGSQILSVGFAGCNLHCPFCQNHHISQNSNYPGSSISPKELIQKAAEISFSPKAIAYTYSEPLIHFEFLLECMKEARREGIANVLISNGCINPEPANKILSMTDAANIDLKSFSEDTYDRILGEGKLKNGLSAVKNFIKTALEKKVHLEITTLIVTGLNDSVEEIDKCTDYIYELEKEGQSIPWHLSAYHPAYKWNKPKTDRDFLISMAKRAGKKVRNVYMGNIQY